MMLDATQNYQDPLTEERLFGWHAALFPTGRSGMHRIRVGAWRDDSSGPMQVVSGPIGKERVHYEAPAAEPARRRRCARSSTGSTGRPPIDPVLKAALAHLWFVTIHPFDDGNGRIARAIADMALARSEQSPKRFYSMSAQIRLERNDYYDILERTQKGTLDITPWMQWFLGCLDRAFDGAEATLASVLRKARFWEAHAGESFNDRQRKVLNRLLDGFEGKLTSSKWAKLAKCSQDTAYRDINDLVGRGILVKAPPAAGARAIRWPNRTKRQPRPDPPGAKKTGASGLPPGVPFGYNPNFPPRPGVARPPNHETASQADAGRTGPRGAPRDVRDFRGRQSPVPRPRGRHHRRRPPRRRARQRSSSSPRSCSSPATAARPSAPRSSRGPGSSPRSSTSSATRRSSSRNSAAARTCAAATGTASPTRRSGSPVVGPV